MNYAQFKLKGGDDATDAKWIRVPSKEFDHMYANHKRVVEVSLECLEGGHFTRV